MTIDSSQTADNTRLFFDPPVGTRMSLAKPGLKKPIWTVFVGMEKDRYILLRLPRLLADSNAPGFHLTVKYVERNLVFGFNAVGIDIIRHPFPLLFLSYPQAVESLNLRDHDRAFCFLPGTLYWAGKSFPGYLINLSRSGCKIALDLAASNHLDMVDQGVQLFSEFSLDCLEKIYAKCDVRNITRDRRNLYLGLRFLEMPEEPGRQIGGYVKKINEFSSGTFK